VQRYGKKAVTKFPDAKIKKVMESLKRPGVAQRVPGGLGSKLS